MYILGISCFYHDSSATLLKDGKIVAAAHEERFTRVKHDNSFPINAINYCLTSQNIGINGIRYIGFYEKPLLKFERVLYQHLEMFPRSFKTFLLSLPSWINEKLRVIKIIKKKLKYKGDVLFVEHHLAHAANAFLVSPFKEAAIVTMDGVGEWTTTAYGYGKNNSIELYKELRFPNSIGLLYSAITAYLGFKVNDSEYKIMGLSAYGNKDKEKNIFYRKLKQVIDVKNDGSFKLDMDYFAYHYSGRMFSKKLCKLLGLPRKPGSELMQKHKDIAAALQMITEKVAIKILNHVNKETKSKNIVLGGGVALNSVLNGKILKSTAFNNIWISPDPGDGGTSLGVASYIYFTILGKKRNYILRNIYLGSEFSSSEIKFFLENNKIKYSKFRNSKELINKTAKLIFQNFIVGWFQLGMEFGPRALGARSILANPCNIKMKQILNINIKHREEFLPFAPSICEDDVLEYFDCDKPIPESTNFMLMVYPIKKKWHKKIPAVVHLDGSGRLQAVKRSSNPLYYDLIKEFGKLSNIPILINTSFNLSGEPIVCTPNDAYKCMINSGIDYLVIDKFLIRREDNTV